MSETVAPYSGWLLALLPGGLWCAWWLWAVNWREVWPVLARGGWLGVLLGMFLAALAWSALFPRPIRLLPFLTIGNFWWQLACVGGLTLAALFCGWLQGRLGWEPAPVSFAPPAEAAHEHGHAPH